MKTFWIKYKWITIVLLAVVILFTTTLTYYRHQVSVLKKELKDTKVRYILEVDSLKTEMIHERIRLTDSILLAEKERYEFILLQYSQTKKEYEKIRADYSDIIINRPEY